MLISTFIASLTPAAGQSDAIAVVQRPTVSATRDTQSGTADDGIVIVPE